ncbi:hypothetical protein AYY19_08480 [Photobacterium aquimaris]|uniref:glycosyltransferase family 4 protein n=1 Tax=Photobacterium aquimaris TaxID=512643 RepID=UPI0007EF3DC0|nr:glycosyltransferase family 4 protein [Photobacterium aquimaris]OBU11939.1 hypothetical protein AYY19_08480 [Photobacterium aquimaris]PSW01973.1 hypothetical protein CTM91_06775 [Photobacterium aquimaris]
MKINQLSRKKTMLISKEYPPQLGGAGVVAENIYDNLDNLLIISSSSRFWFVIMFFKVLLNKKRKEKFIINDVGAMFICGLLFNHEELSKSILWLHGSEKEKAFSPKSKIKKILLFKKITMRVFKSVRYRVFVSHFLKEKFSDIPCDTGKSVVISNILNNKFKNKNNNIDVIRHNKSILTVSRLIKEKGYDKALECFLLLPEEYVWNIVGDGPYLTEFRNIVTEMGVQHRINFLGHKGQIELIDIYKENDIFLLLSDFEESFGLVYVEAMYFGLLVIANDKGAIKETLNGFYGVEIVNSSATALEISDKIKRIKYKKIFFEKNKILIDEKYSSDTFKYKVERLLND